MIVWQWLLAGLAAVTVALIAILLRRPGAFRGEGSGGKILAFMSFFALPVVASGIGLSAHMEASKTTTFCLSCHVMEPWGRSLRADDPGRLAASHFQNGRVDRDHACFTCHTTYTLFGNAKAKLGGLRHVYVNYLGEIPKTIKTYKPYDNRECLHCHGGARSFEEDDTHKDIRDELATGKTSCLECHGPAHDTEHLAGVALWQEETR